MTVSSAFKISSSYPTALLHLHVSSSANHKIAMSSSEFEDETTAYVPLVLILPIFFRRLTTGIIYWECVSSHLPWELSKLAPKDPRSRYSMVTCTYLRASRRVLPKHNANMMSMCVIVHTTGQDMKILDISTLCLKALIGHSSEASFAPASTIHRRKGASPQFLHPIHHSSHRMSATYQ